MTSLAALRQQLAAVIAPPPASRPGSGIPTGIPTGIAALDAVLTDGGLPLGRLTEIVGARGCGKTTLVREIVARALDDKRWVAYIDTARTLAPADWASLATTERLWIVRPPTDGTAAPPAPTASTASRTAPSESGAHGPWCADVLLRSGAFGLVVLDGSGPLTHSIAVRLTRLARESNAAFVMLREEETTGLGGGGLRGAVRLRVQVRRARDELRPAPAPLRPASRDPAREAGHNRWSVPALAPHGTGRRGAPGLVPAPPAPPATPNVHRGSREDREFRATRVLQVTVEKGGTHHLVEVGCAIDVARRLCAHPQVPDRRGVAARNRRGERAAPDTPGIRRATPPADGARGRGGPTAPGGHGSVGATLAHKRRCAEPAIARDEFLLVPRPGAEGRRGAPTVAPRPLARPPAGA